MFQRKFFDEQKTDTHNNTKVLSSGSKGSVHEQPFSIIAPILPHCLFTSASVTPAVGFFAGKQRTGKHL